MERSLKEVFKDVEAVDYRQRLLEWLKSGGRNE